ncbi:non-ribosomal peptide synthetase [Anabaena subtropica]|uniref:Amino acid adenylation domain-containing protein n=1 Tax=Anabaena subtropica FACHB-260 TaxID=2692884 RepID=A0ABR8CPW4_9NOST|nr:non-ribosomal peptide synthetase [Anabaena subtropica]MBD2344918.1 amino acid adenylation domain-containing protein [Anabaena subtropica FACHB-260]
MSDFSQQIAALSPEQRLIFEKRLKQKGLNHVRTSEISKLEIPKRKDINRLPLSFAQQRLWFFQQLNPDSGAYNVFSALCLEGQLNATVLEQVFNEIIKRHESLRTTFTTDSQGQPVQLINPHQPYTLSRLDLRDVPNQQEEVESLATQEAEEPFDLTKPLLKITLLQLEEAKYVLLLKTHHIISDRWSLGIFVREMKVLYEAFSHQQLSLGDATHSLLLQGITPLPELPIQYADWAVWQQQYLQGEVLATQMDYWKKQLANLPILELPTDKPRPAVAKYQGATQTFELSKTLSDALKALSVKQGVTLFTLLLTVFKVLLYKYTYQNDIVVGTDIANRNRVETEGLIGFLINTLVLRTDLSENPTFCQLLSRVRETTLKAYDHQDLSFDKLVDILKPERNLSEMVPLFQVKFDLQQTQVEPLELAELKVSPLIFDNGTAKFELRFNLSEGVQGITGLVEYSTDIFARNTITRMVEHYRNLLEAIVANPQQQLSEVSLLTEPEKNQLLVEWNDTKVEYSQDQCIYQLFEAQVERTPDAVAVVFADQQLTYRELNARANQLAHYLQALGVKSEVLVGIFIERSLDMLVGLLAILKAGGAYIPLDPSYPQERLAFILEDAQATVLLTTASLVQAMPQHQAKVVCLDTDCQAIAQQSQENVSCNLTPDNLAYVIYTSGSTGKPKGVQIPHQALSNFLSAMKQRPGLTEKDILLAVTTISFDIAALELFLPLVVGGRLVIASREIASDGTQLSAKLIESKATVMQGTPATWKLLLASGWSGNNQLKILCGGEALPPHLANQLLHRCAALWNMYGPTETTIWSAASLIESDRKIVPIGHPIANTQFYILDQYNQLVPVGVTGELHIGGAGLARGYLNRPDLTAEKFIPNPFSKQATRLYKTGDLARYLPNGEIEYIGRIDHQVKVRGFRIELGEIETILCQHPAVQETVVTVHASPTDSQRIVAYVVPNSEQMPMISELRDFLEAKLPNYMMPSAFVTLEALPLTPNGKVDRKALPTPDTVRPELKVVYQPPQTEVEKTIAEIWQEVLDIENVGIHDNFFELGGQSLLLVQVHSKLQKIFQRNFPLVEMFQYPTVSHLAKYFSQKQSEETSFLKPSHIPENRTASVQRRKQARKEHRAAKGKEISSQ